MKFNKNTNFKANLALNAGNFGRENVNFAANLAVNLSQNGENLSQNENAVNLQPKRHKFTT